MHSDSLCIKVEDFNQSFSILQYNVDQAMREEKHETGKWNYRKERIAKLIKETNADIVCLQEMRQLPECESVNKFLSSFDEYDFKVEYRNASKLSFGQAILYKRDKFYCMETAKRWLSSTPDQVSDDWSVLKPGSTGFGAIVMGCKFLFVDNDKIVSNAKAFWVFNTHFLLEEEHKTKSCHSIVLTIKKITNGLDYLLTGDFNFFSDKNGARQTDIIESCMDDLSFDALTLKGYKTQGTFVGFYWDKFHAPLPQLQSNLDHIFGNEYNWQVLKKVLYTKTMLDVEPEELTTRNFPSDHLPILMSVKLL